MNTDWHLTVYKKDKKDILEDWHEIRKSILERDEYRCFRCESTNRKNLTVHHIIPRSEGGKENRNNLITLCGNCHDLVEVSGFRSLVEIIASADFSPILEKEIKEVHKRVEEDFERPEWHKYVYGGVRRNERR
jgi:hypothetical protein